jgi:glycosyltransferase involved in cell wall biosynthesis
VNPSLLSERQEDALREVANMGSAGAASMLARLEIQGLAVGRRWEMVAQAAEQTQGQHLVLFTVPHQAMARGVPVIGPMFGGLAEFLTVESSYIVFARLQPSANENGGVEAIVDLGSMVEQMRRIYFDRPELRQKRLRSKHRAEQFTWDRTVTEVEAVLEEASLITEAIF